MEQYHWFHFTNKDRAVSGSHITCHGTQLVQGRFGTQVYATPKAFPSYTKAKTNVYY